MTTSRDAESTDTPSTDEVRDYYEMGVPADTWLVAREKYRNDFDRWLAGVKAEAWDEGLLVGQDPYGFDTTNNPYRKDQT